MNSTGIVVKRHKNLGKTGSDKTGSDKTGLNKAEIDVRNLPDGLYYVIAKSGTISYTTKFIKL